MLAQPEIARSKTGASMRDFLREFLPFEQQSLAVIQSVAAIIGDPSLSDAERDSLWRKGQRNSAYLAGFLTAQSCFRTLRRTPVRISSNRPLERMDAAGQRLIEDFERVGAEGQYRRPWLVR